MGAWTFVAPRLRAAAGNAIPVTYIGRPERASPAEGYQASHQREQSHLVAEVLGRPATPRAGTIGIPREARGDQPDTQPTAAASTGSKSS